MSDTLVRPATVEEEIALEARFAPTEIWTQTESGIEVVPVTVPREAPDALQIAMLEEPQFLTTGLMWAGLAMAGRIECMVEYELPTTAFDETNMLQVLPEQTKLWLTGWQRLINDGSCWQTSGSIGRTADELMDRGYLLAAKVPTLDWVGAQMKASGREAPTIFTRDQLSPGTAGTPLFVQTVMGKPYLDWIAAI